MPNSRHSGAIFSPSNSRAINFRRSSMGLHAFQGILRSPQKARLCNPCARNELSPLSQKGQRANRTANAGRSRLYASSGSERLKQAAFRADDADLSVSHLDAVGERAEMIAAVTAAIDPDPLARRPGEPLDHLWRDRLLTRRLQHRGGTCGVGLRLVADRFEACDTLLQHWVVEIGDAGLDGVIEPLEPQVGLGRALVQLGDMLAAALGALLPAIEDRRQHLLDPLRLEQPFGNMLRDEVVEPLHRDRPALAARLALPGFDRTSVIAIPPSLPGPERHGAAAVGAEADAGKEGRTAHDARGHDLGIAGTQVRLHRIECRLIDQRRHLDGDDLARWLRRLVLGALVELMPADIGRPRQDAVDLADAPAPAVPRGDAMPVEIGRDVLDAHRTGCAVAFQREA